MINRYKLITSYILTVSRKMNRKKPFKIEKIPQISWNKLEKECKAYVQKMIQFSRTIKRRSE